MSAQTASHDRVNTILLVLGVIAMCGGVGCVIYNLLRPGTAATEIEFPPVGVTDDATTAPLSPLTGLELAEGQRVDDPTYCVQTPNGLDGARPQVGLSEAGVIFEAIAEAGITRFAAIYQAPTSGVIGPIRSLRTYYLEWDTPFDCLIVHAGGATDALAKLKRGDYRDLDEEPDYTYRGRATQRAWNNLFTTPDLLAQANAGATSHVVGFDRLTPAESFQQLLADSGITPLDITAPTAAAEPEITVPEVAVNFGGAADYNVVYDYDPDTNTYPRSYASGAAHLVYQCPTNNTVQRDPEDFCELTQLAPAVIVVLMVRESPAADHYHEDITTTGIGDAYIFQNGSVIEGTWSKASATDQLKFFDADGAAVKLAVGQTIVEAVPSYGSVTY